MIDVELEFMVLAAMPTWSWRTGRKVGAVRVFLVGDPEADRYELTWGACEARWAQHPDHRLGMLHQLLWVLVQGYGYEPAEVHRALTVVPEYRALHG